MPLNHAFRHKRRPDAVRGERGAAMDLEAHRHMDFLNKRRISGPVAVAIAITKQGSRTSLWIQLRIYDGTRNLTLAKNETILKLDRDEKLSSIYPYPTTATGVERVGQVWYPRQSPDAAVTRETGFMGGSRHAALDPYWPKFHEEEGWIVELPPVPPPEETWNSLILGNG